MIRTFLISAAILFASSSNADNLYDGGNNLVIGYLPPMSQQELNDESTGAASAVDHVEWAVFETVKCLQKSGITALPKSFMGRVVVIQFKRFKKEVKLPVGWPQESGLVLVKPGTEPLVIPSQAGPSSLLVLGPEGASRYFDARDCNGA